MAYKQEVIENLEGLLKTEDEIGLLLRKQDIYLMLHPKLAGENALQIRTKISNLIESIDKQEKELKDLVGEIKGKDQDVY